MKRNILYLAIVLVAFPLSSSAWGRLGHRTIAELAERHLTEKARKNIMYYTKGEHLSTYACFMDEVSKTDPYTYEFRGWHAAQADVDCTSSREYRAKCRREGRDGVTAMEDFREQLASYRTLDDSTVLNAIKCIVHIVGDFHCPAHLRYEDCNNSGKEKVTYFGKATTLHKVWDSGVITRAHKGQTPSQFADYLDTYDKKQIRKVQKGWAQEWFEDAARDIRPTINTVHKGDELGEEFQAKAIPLAELEMRKAGYQLAAALNTIFGK